MKKPLLIAILFLFSYLSVSAQNNSPIVEDFLTGVKDLHTIAVNEHLNILRVNNNNESFELIAVDDKMQVLWRNTFPGFAIDAGSFKGKIVALVSPNHDFLREDFFSRLTGDNSLKAYSIDAETGKLLVNKVIYTGLEDYLSFAEMSTCGGSFFKIIVRQSNYKRKQKLIFGEGNTEWNQTTNLQLIDLNENLEPINSFKPAISNGSLISTTWNKKGDMFLSWFNGPTVEVFKYNTGKTEPSSQLNVTVTFKEDKDVAFKDVITFCPSASSGDALYYTIIYKNPDKEIELGIGKFDFANEKKLFESIVITKNYLKTVKKTFVPFDKNFDDVNIGFPKGMRVKFLEEVEGKILIGMSSIAILSNSNSHSFSVEESSPILTCYDKDLQMKFQTVFAGGYIVPYRTLQTAFYHKKNKLHLVANAKGGLFSIDAFYGSLDISTGKWDKMEKLSKRGIDKTAFIEGNSVMWYGDNYVLPYYLIKGITGKKINVSIQQNSYN